MGVRKRGTHLAQTLFKPRCLCKYSGVPYDIPISLAISAPSVVDRPSLVFQWHDNNHPWLPQLAVELWGHVLPRLNLATHLMTIAYDWALSPETYTER